MLRPFVTLPGVASARNPFGVLGLFYACDLNTRYAGSVLGSTPSAERGGVIAIHLPDGGQTALLHTTDVMGVLVPFTFSLQANATDTPQLRRAVWAWDAAVGRWALRQPAMP